MKKLIVYQSKTGFSEKYAEWLGNELIIEVIPMKEIKKKKIIDYDQIIFVTSIMANMLNGLKKIQKENPKNLVILAVGLTEMSKDYEETIKTTNKIDYPLFYVRGGVNYEKLNLLFRGMLKKITKQPKSVDLSSINYLDSIKTFLKEE